MHRAKDLIPEIFETNSECQGIVIEKHLDKLWEFYEYLTRIDSLFYCNQ